MAALSGSKVLPTSEGFNGIGIRNVRPKSRPTVVLDCQISMNTPPTKEHTTVRGPHIGAYGPIPSLSTP
eukprot:5969197-Pyramimonas_sp.AAC.1